MVESRCGRVSMINGYMQMNERFEGGMVMRDLPLSRQVRNAACKNLVAWKLRRVRVLQRVARGMIILR